MRIRLALLALLAGMAVTVAAAPRPGAHREVLEAGRFKAVVFDYLVLFNPDSVISEVERVFPGKGKELTNRWRTRQFEYSWLRSITHQYVDFLAITEDALVYAVDTMNLTLTPNDRRRLLDAYLHLEPWPDTVETLSKLKTSGIAVVTLANFSPTMLRLNAEHAGLTRFFDLFLSTDLNQTYKPDPRAYELAVEHLGLNKQDILFAAFGGWDAAGAKAFGYPTFWVNRFGQPLEQLGSRPDGSSENLNGLLDFVLTPPSSIGLGPVTDHTPQGRSLFIAVRTAPDIETTLVDRVLEETEAIWSAAGVSFEWERTSPSDGRRRPQIDVTIEDEAQDSSKRQGPLGWIPFTDAGPQASIHLSRSMAEVLCAQWPTIEDRTASGHQRLIGRALGRALSHELGHYLFQSKLHTPHGLMRANWPSDELFAVDRHGFVLSVEQREFVENLWSTHFAEDLDRTVR